MRQLRPTCFETLVRACLGRRPRSPESLPVSTSSAPKLERALTPSTLLSADPLLLSGASPFGRCAAAPVALLFRLAHGSLAFAAVVLATLALLAAPTLANSAAHEVQSVGLTVFDLDREVRFFTQVLSFEEVSRSEAKGRATDDLLGLKNARLLVAQLRLGSESITLTEHKEKGSSIPSDSRSHDHWFQHIAIVVSDMNKAYAHLRKNQVRHVSTGPQTLPEWNANAAGIKAFYFRDPEDHVLEIIWFPPGKGDPRWQQPTTRLFQGIDHTAVVVSDTERSLDFYRDVLGMKVAGESENYGVEQEHLNQVFGARLRITGLRAGRGPGIEFLEYLTPPGGRPLPQNSKANDLTFWRTHLKVDRLDELAGKLRETGVRLVSKGMVTESGNSLEPGKTLIVRDPDGHALQLMEPSPTATASTR